MRFIPVSRPLLRLLALGVTLGVMAGLLHLASEWAAARAVAEVSRSATQRLEIYAASLNDAIERFAYFPATISLNEDLAALIAAPGDAALGRRVNAYLETAAQTSGAIVLYMMDARGITLASSNWNTPLSYVGMNFGFRPYVQEGLAGRQGRFYAVGVVTGTPGYFISAPVRRNGRVIGTVAIKVSLDATEAHWRETGEKVMVVDRAGIVSLSSDPQWKFRVLQPLDAAARQQLAQTRQYEREHFEPLALDVAGDGGRRVSELRDGVLRHYVRVARELPGHEWRLLLLADARPVAEAVRTARFLVALVLLAAMLLVLYWIQRRRRIRDKLAAQHALERAHADLERQVEMRTADLRNAQTELVQAAKMAVLGQMAAGVTHELNQPLTAMRSLAENARRFLEQQNAAQADRNLQLIAQLVERMGRITGQLRNFSRKSQGDAQPVALAAAVADALTLLEQRIHAEGVVVELAPALAAAVVRFDPLRLQQILINLLRNALDALTATPQPAIEIGVRDEGERLVLTIADNGPGIDAAVLPRVFDPFFTTKPAGEGLGLGLAVSLAIARDYGAQLEALAPAGAGARFELRLTPAATPHKDGAHD